MSILSNLTTLFAEEFKNLDLDAKYGEVVTSQRPDLSQFQCNGALPAAKTISANPREVAEKIVNSLSDNEIFKEISIAGPGFINITVTDEYIVENLNQTSKQTNFGVENPNPQKVLVDYGGANVAKDLHVGHLRPALIGESLKRIYRFAQNNVIGDIHLGDWGLPMGQLLAILEERYPDLPYFDEQYQGEYPNESPVSMKDLQKLYPEASAKSKEDEQFAEKARKATVSLQNREPGPLALWNHFRNESIESLKRTYDSLGVDFDIWNGEASVSPRIEPMLEQLAKLGVTTDSQGAIIIQFDEEENDDIPPLILVNSRGGSTYATTDLATIYERIEEFNVDKIVYVVDNRQELHFRQLFKAIEENDLLDKKIQLVHAGNGTVNDKDGKPLKTRHGNLPLLNDLVKESKELAKKKITENNLGANLTDDELDTIASQVGIGALAYGELSNHRTTNYNFDLDRFTQIKGETGPYLQYVAVRAKSVLDKSNELSYQPKDFQNAVNDSERQLSLKLLELPEIINRTIETNSPNTIAEYTYSLASHFNQFYDQNHITSQENVQIRESWLALVKLTREVLVQLLDLLCIPIPEKM